MKKAGDKLVVINFCLGYCQNNPKFLKALEEKYASKMDMLRVDADEVENIAYELYEVDGFPTFIFSKKGRVVKRITGKDKATRELEEAIVEHTS